VIDRFNFADGARRAGLHPKHEGRLAALVLRAAGYPVTHDGVMDDAGVAFLWQHAEVAVKAFWDAKHDGAVELLESRAARKAGHRLAASLALGSVASDQDPATEALAA
jgi:hypothetical protein